MPLAVLFFVFAVIVASLVHNEVAHRRRHRSSRQVTVPPAPMPAMRVRQPSTPNAGPYRAPAERRAAVTPAARPETLHKRSLEEHLLREVRDARVRFDYSYPTRR